MTIIKTAINTNKNNDNNKNNRVIITKQIIYVITKNYNKITNRE